MGKKLTEEEVISRFRDVHGEFEQTPAKHINRKHGYNEIIFVMNDNSY